MHNPKLTGQKISLALLLIVLIVAVINLFRQGHPEVLTLGGLGVAIGVVLVLLIYDFWRNPAKESADPLVWDPQIVVDYAKEALVDHDLPRTKKMVMSKFVITDEEADALIAQAVEERAASK
ncbi:hypothetical protein [Lacticaseibacillus brantae]|uniref:Uncharacterized protein n=1 Tax=Lacticaseibacillus brantae DSM 23927 TaxID=1423727 RepID=A0A0R2AXM0_9LACO|nr:hypothetical protein [Lacticaseibacillus brantae]KRM71751.1 hypothetical protein FC34_GL001410 [Lacticaseibacillus brantae DSM 23927]